MRILFVSNSLPNSLTLEQIGEAEPVAKKVISKTFASTGQVKNPILSLSHHQKHQLQQKQSEEVITPRRSNSHSTTSQRTSISLITAEEQIIEDLRFEEKNLNTIWKFTELPGHAAIAAASSLSPKTEKLFIGWPGPIQNGQGKGIDYSDFAPEMIDQIAKLYLRETLSIPVFLDSASVKGHTNYCNSTLWPILHYIIWENPVQCKEIVKDWENYVRVNEIFAEKILEVYKAGDIIWILDHHLLLLPGLIRAKLQKALIGLYLRNTFPSSELFRCLPQANELLKGMLGSNLIGFQAYAYARHFTSCCTRVLGLEASLLRIDYEGAPVELTVIPTGIEACETIETLKSEEVRDKVERFLELYHGMAVLVGIDRFNQNKGVLHKLNGYERFLKDHPEWIGRVILVQVILPEQDVAHDITAPPHSADLSVITDMAAQINSHYGSIEYTPVAIYHQDIDLPEYYALLQVADCFISTKERDSLSLVPLDFVLCQEIRGKKSPIILSEFTALSGSMSTSILVNPWDHASIAQSISSSLIMSSDEKSSRHQILIDYVMENSKTNWSELFLTDLLACQDLIEKYGPSSYLDFNLVKEKYRKSKDRYFFLDYDGTLTPIVKTPSGAIPGSKTLESLKNLTADSRNKVFIISGRDCVTLEHWLGGIENLGMSAEHGCFLKLPKTLNSTVKIENSETKFNGNEWQNLVANQNEEWKGEVMQVFEYFTERTPGSFVEHKAASLTWHYRQCDPEFGSWQAKQCQSLLENTISGKMSVEILAGKKNLEVRPVSINKGQTLHKILSEGYESIQADFIFCAGDDRTDEDMFKALMEMETEIESFKNKENEIFTCAIGAAEKKTLARFHVNNPDQLINLLLQLTSNE